MADRDARELLNAPLGDQLWAVLDAARDVLARKTDGLDAAGLAHPLPPTTMTLGGLLSHLAYVEDFWFSHRFAGNPPAEPWAGVDWSADNDWDWHLAADLSPEELRSLWRESVARSRAVVAGADWDQRSAIAGRSGRAPDLGWIVLHLVDEYARHNGHADLLREAVDGRVGD